MLPLFRAARKFCSTNRLFTLHGLCPDTIRHTFAERPMIFEYGTRNDIDLKTPIVRLKIRFYFLGGKSWNEIPDSI